MDQFHNTPSKYINIFLKANCSLTKGLKEYQWKLKQAYALMDQFHNTPSKYVNIFLNVNRSLTKRIEPLPAKTKTRTVVNALLHSDKQP